MKIIGNGKRYDFFLKKNIQVVFLDEYTSYSFKLKTIGLILAYHEFLMVSKVLADVFSDNLYLESNGLLICNKFLFLRNIFYVRLI